ncbi:hypothetical protein [Pararhizobium haloflavum]|uniref:hypothetical protein n=1 Tax=Pararhizobium haloflavum TaxID=2037914 RepID=UPI000C1765AD|nr:hypothetical protein [Pararhizobium haloflavum]
MQRQNANERAADPAIDRAVLNNIQTAPNRRMLGRIPSFRLEDETPEPMRDLLRRMEQAERRRTRSS